MYFLFINKTLWLNNLKTSTAMNAKTSVFVVCVEAIVYLLVYNFHDCTFNHDGFLSYFMKNTISFLKGTLSGLRQCLVTENLSKRMKNAFYFILTSPITIRMLLLWFRYEKKKSKQMFPRTCCYCDNIVQEYLWNISSNHTSQRSYVNNQLICYVINTLLEDFYTTRIQGINTWKFPLRKPVTFLFY